MTVKLNLQKKLKNWNCEQQQNFNKNCNAKKNYVTIFFVQKQVCDNFQASHFFDKVQQIVTTMFGIKNCDKKWSDNIFCKKN